MAKFLSSFLRKDFKSEIDRNTFDTSKRHYGSYNIGGIYPIYIRHCQSNETVTIRPSVILDMETLNHQLYNDIRCNIRWFKVNTRALWKDYRKFVRQDITKDSTIVAPFISRADTDWWRVGSLANHLGIPCVSYSLGNTNTQSSFLQTPVTGTGVSIVMSPSVFRQQENTLDSFFNYTRRDIKDIAMSESNIYKAGSDIMVKPLLIPYGDISSKFRPNLTPILAYNLNFSQFLSYSSNQYGPAYVLAQGLNVAVADNLRIRLPHVGNNYTSELQVIVIAGDSLANASFVTSTELSMNADTAFTPGHWTMENQVKRTAYAFGSSPEFTTCDYVLDLPADIRSQIQQLQQRTSFVSLIVAPVCDSEDFVFDFATINHYPTDLVQTVTEDSSYWNVLCGFYNYPSYSSVSEVNTSKVAPWLGVNPVEPLSVLPFRAYRAVYNSHFRDKIHDPLRDAAGNIMVDQFVENMDSGADNTTKLEIEYATYDDDYFNTCIPHPTMGDDVVRPLVGITTGETPEDAILNYNVNGEAYSISTKIHASDGTITQVDTPTNSAHNNDLTYLTLKDAVQYGISIQDLRDKEALTKWLEANYRGNARFSHNDFMRAHFGVEPSERLDIEPELLGGDTIYVTSQQVLNTTASSTSDVPLGHRAGIAGFSANSKDITAFCNDDCYIIGVMWFSVDNINAQAMDKMWYLRQPMDYATPEFADLGVMPVLLKEVAPLQVPNARLNDTFGYQRIYGDKLYEHDTVAGDFLTDKSDYLMIRRFDDIPELTADFNVIHPEALTNVYAIPNMLDKIYGRFFFEIKKVTWLSQQPNAHIL